MQVHCKFYNTIEFIISPARSLTVVALKKKNSVGTRTMILYATIYYYNIIRSYIKALCVSTHAAVHNNIGTYEI